MWSFFIEGGVVFIPKSVFLIEMGVFKQCEQTDRQSNFIKFLQKKGLYIPSVCPSVFFIFEVKKGHKLN